MALPDGFRWQSSDGAIVQIRRIRSSDLELETAFVAALSPRTGYQRLMSPRTPLANELERWVRVDSDNEVALIAVVGERDVRQVGVARFVRLDGVLEAEFAIVLSDDWQGRGLGRVLLQCLVDEARAGGLSHLVGSTLSENQGMLRLAKSLGCELRKALGGAFVTDLRLKLSN